MRLFSKLCIMALSLFFCTQLFAGGSEQPTENGFDGFYGGLGVGISQATFRDRETADSAGTNVGSTLISFDYLTDTSFAGAVQLGYGWQWNHYYFGFYAQGVFYNLSRSGNFSMLGGNGQGVIYSALVRLTNSASFGIKPGYFLSPTTLIYLQIAANYARAHVDKNIQAILSNGISLFTNSTQNIRKDMIALCFGLGVEQKISHNVSLWLSYLYTYYGNVTGISNDNNTEQNTRVRFNNSTLLAGMNYYFNPSSIRVMHNIPHAFHGFYLGVFGGYQQIFTRNVLGLDTYNPATAQSADLDEVVLNLKNEDPVLGFLLGYNIAWRLFNLGFSADTTFGIRYTSPTQFNSQSSGGNSIINLQSTMTEQDFGSVAIAPGFSLGGNTLLFAKFAAVFSNFKLFANKKIGVVGFGFIVNNSYSTTRSRVGFRLGLGIEHKFNRLISLYLLDQYTLYSKIIFNTNVISNIGGVVIDENFYNQVKPHNNQVLLGVNFYL